MLITPSTIPALAGDVQQLGWITELALRQRAIDQWSRGDDVTIANPLGPPVRGWGQVEEHLEQAASTAREGEPLRYESISEYSTGDLGYNLELEWTRAKFGGAEEMTPVSLRATTIFRREEGEWKIVHRHADPITTTQPAESVIQQ
jgi:ketosteroid isomerase-like protein